MSNWPIREITAQDTPGLAASGTTTARLFCLPENTRARRFYERIGWNVQGTVIEPVDSAEGPFPLEVLELTKKLGRQT